MQEERRDVIVAQLEISWFFVSGEQNLNNRINNANFFFLCYFKFLNLY